jgi:hypothetical protein
MLCFIQFRKNFLWFEINMFFKIFLGGKFYFVLRNTHTHRHRHRHIYTYIWRKSILFSLISDYPELYFTSQREGLKNLLKLNCSVLHSPKLTQIGWLEKFGACRLHFQPFQEFPIWRETIIIASCFCWSYRHIVYLFSCHISCNLQNFKDPWRYFHLNENGKSLKVAGICHCLR